MNFFIYAYSAKLLVHGYMVVCSNTFEIYCLQVRASGTYYTHITIRELSNSNNILSPDSHAKRMAMTARIVVQELYNDSRRPETAARHFHSWVLYINP